MKYLQTDKIPHDIGAFLKRFTKKTLQHIARLILQKYKPKIIAISGSVGKTLTKEAIYLILSKNHSVRKSEKSFTAELGVPLTIIGCPQGTGSIVQWIQNILFGFKILIWNKKYPSWLVLEIDNDKSGDLQTVSALLRPDILVMTALGDVPAHIENFVSSEDFMREQNLLISSVKKDGVIIYNADDEAVRSLLSASDVRKVSCGIGAGDVKGSVFEAQYNGVEPKQVPVGMTFALEDSSGKYAINISGTIGVQNEYACLLSFAVGLEMKLEPKKIVSQLNKYTPLPGRMRVLAGIKDSVILDDSYNSGPEALSHAVVVLKQIKTRGRKIVVVGDMLELGRYSAIEHRKIADLLKGSVGFVLTVGFRAQKIVDELIGKGFKKDHLLSFYNSVDAGKSLQNILKAGDVVLVKGSQVMRMERTVEEVMQNPENKRRLLVRQEKEWLIR